MSVTDDPSMLMSTPAHSVTPISPLTRVDCVMVAKRKSSVYRLRHSAVRFEPSPVTKSPSIVRPYASDTSRVDGVSDVVGRNKHDWGFSGVGLAALYLVVAAMKRHFHF